jgi:hypothetical protein
MNTTRSAQFCSLFAFGILLLGSSPDEHAFAQGPGDMATPAQPIVRPCARQSGSKSGRKGKTKGKVDASSQQFALACLEVQGSPLDVQEFFQSYVRAQNLRFRDEKILPDGWMFVRYLDKDELLQFAKEGRFAGRVIWTGGKALVVVTTRELNSGFTRVEVIARVQGFGQNVDRFLPARDSWDLDSNGLLEKGLITALEDHIKSVH